MAPAYQGLLRPLHTSALVCNTGSGCENAVMTSPTADVSVRVGWADDAPGIAGVQVRAWRQYADLLPDEVLAAMDPEDFATAWHESLARPKDAQPGAGGTGAQHHPRLRGHRPCLRPRLRPGGRRRGRGAHRRPADPAGPRPRLVQACAETLKADRFTRAVVWLNSTDDVRRAFLTEAGFAPDGAHRELDLHGTARCA